MRLLDDHESWISVRRFSFVSGGKVKACTSCVCCCRPIIIIPGILLIVNSIFLLIRILQTIRRFHTRTPLPAYGQKTGQPLCNIVILRPFVDSLSLLSVPKASFDGFFFRRPAGFLQLSFFGLCRFVLPHIFYCAVCYSLDFPTTQVL